MDQTMTKPMAKFSLDQAQAAADAWGANCGPGAIAAVLDTTLDAIRPYLGEFEAKHYTNPRLMFQILDRMGVQYRRYSNAWFYPDNGLMRVQWEGPWTEPGVPLRKRYRHTHWVATRKVSRNIYVFDINCICVGGWVPFREWNDQVVPWLLRQVEPFSSGKWHPTHIVDILREGKGSL